MNKVFDEQVILDEISNYKAYKELLEKIEQLEKERSILLNCVLDIHTMYNDQRVKQAFEEIGDIYEKS